MVHTILRKCLNNETKKSQTIINEISWYNNVTIITHTVTISKKRLSVHSYNNTQVVTIISHSYNK